MADTLEAKKFTMPGVVRVALDSKNPELIKALAEEAKNKLTDLGEANLIITIAELLRYIAVMREQDDKNAKLVAVYEDLTRSIRSSAEDIEGACEEMRERICEIHNA